MKKIIYICNRCGELLSDPNEDKFQSHISLDLKIAGWVDNTKYKIDYDRERVEQNEVLHFCNERCLAEYFKH